MKLFILFASLALIIILMLVLSKLLTYIITDDRFIAAIVAFIGISLFTYTIYYLDRTPNALDVYRNRTELIITYRDSVAIDSTVVYKNKK